MLHTAATDTTFSQLDYVRESLEDAESLLQYASETGFGVDDVTKKAVLDARAAFAKGGLDELTTANLLAALARLAKMVSPVTPESLRVSPKRTGKNHQYWHRAVWLTVIIIVYSTLSFVTSSIASSIRADVTTANDLAVKLSSEFPTTEAPTQTDIAPRPGGGCRQTRPPAAKDTSITSLPTSQPRSDVVKDLQEYASSIRNIDAHARELSFYMHPYARIVHPERLDPFYWIRNCPDDLTHLFELPLPLTDYALVAEDRTWTYQRVRYFGQHLADDVSFYYGAVSSSILPVLYALLGTFAYILRTYERRVRERSYVPSSTDSARFVTSAIGGAVVGLFSNFTLGEGVKVSPLALAFLVGYAVDVFYAFLETLIDSFTKTALGTKTAAGAASPPPIQQDPHA